MPWTDDRIADAMRELDPAHTAPDAAPRSGEWTRMRGVMAEAPARRRPARRAVLRWAWALPAIAVIAAVALSIGPLTAGPAYAQTPPPLHVEPLASTTDQVFATSLKTLRRMPATTAARDAAVVRWALREDTADAPTIVPEWQEWVWNDDGTGYLKATAGAPYSVTADGRIVPPAGDAPREGTALDDPQNAQYRYGHFPEAPPAEVEALRIYLQRNARLAPDADALAYWGAISALRDEWTLTPAQQAAALELLQQTGDVSLLGAVTDRFGREGIALSVSSADRPSFGATIVLDEQSREIIAADIAYLGGVDRLDIPADSVIEYSAWLLPAP